MPRNILLLFIFIGFFARAQTDLVIKLSPSYGKDARIDSRSSQANLNFGNSPDLGVWAYSMFGSLSVNRTLLSFPLSQIPPNALIQSARLYMYYNPSSSFTMGQSGSNTVKISRITGDWKEDSVTWNNQPATSTVNQVSTSFSVDPNSPNLEGIAMTNMLISARDSGAINLDLMIQLNTEQISRSMILASSEHPDSLLRPRIEIHYGLPGVDLIAPILVDSFEANKPILIRWNALGINSVSIDYCLGDTNWTTIASNIPSGTVNNSYSWIPEIVSPQCKIRVRSSLDPSLFDVSWEWFKIVEGPYINYQFPVPGSILTSGEIQEIRWTAYKVPQVKISYAVNPSDFIGIDSNINAHAGTYFWQLPIISSDSVFIKISSQNTPGVYAQNKLPLRISPLPWFQISDPGDTIIWESGSIRRITWSARNTKYSSLYYRKEGFPWQILCDSIDKDTFYHWTLPQDLSGNIKLRVTDPLQRVFGDSTAFWIHVIQPIVDTPQVVLKYPKGGENFIGGSSLNIQWESKHIDSLYLEMKHGSSPWFAITSSIPFTSTSYSYSLPDINQLNNFVRIKGVGKGKWVADSSTIAFSISKSSGIFGLNPMHFQVFPNPVTEDKFEVSIPMLDSKMVEVSMINLFGQLIFKQSYNSRQIILVPSPQNGFYTLQIQFPEVGQLTKKILVNRF